MAIPTFGYGISTREINHSCRSHYEWRIDGSTIAYGSVPDRRRPKGPVSFTCLLFLAWIQTSVDLKIAFGVARG